MQIKSSERGLSWRVRRVAHGLRQIDVALGCGISATAYSLFERGEKTPTRLDCALIERMLPPLPAEAKTPAASIDTPEVSDA